MSPKNRAQRAASRNFQAPLAPKHVYTVAWETLARRYDHRVVCVTLIHLENPFSGTYFFPVLFSALKTNGEKLTEAVVQERKSSIVLFDMGIGSFVGTSSSLKEQEWSFRGCILRWRTVSSTKCWKSASFCSGELGINFTRSHTKRLPVLLPHPVTCSFPPAVDRNICHNSFVVRMHSRKSLEDDWWRRYLLHFCNFGRWLNTSSVTTGSNVKLSPSSEMIQRYDSDGLSLLVVVVIDIKL